MKWKAEFDMLFSKERERLVKAARRMLKDKELAEDLANDVFCIAWKKWEDVRGIEEPYRWLYGTLKKCCKRENQRKHYSTEVFLDREEDGRLAALSADYSLLEALPTSTPPEERDLLYWRYKDGLDVEAIADRLGIKYGAAQKRVERAYKRYLKFVLDDAESTTRAAKDTTEKVNV